MSHPRPRHWLGTTSPSYKPPQGERYKLNTLRATIEKAFQTQLSREVTPVELVGLLAWADLFGVWGTVGQGEEEVANPSGFGYLPEPGLGCSLPFSFLYDGFPKLDYSAPFNPVTRCVKYFGFQGFLGDALQSGSDFMAVHFFKNTPEVGALFSGAKAESLVAYALQSGIAGVGGADAQGVARLWDDLLAAFLDRVSSAYKQLSGGQPLPNDHPYQASGAPFLPLPWATEPVPFKVLERRVRSIQERAFPSGQVPPMSNDAMVKILALAQVLTNRGFLPLDAGALQTYNFSRASAVPAGGACPANYKEYGGGKFCLAVYPTLDAGLRAYLAALMLNPAWANIRGALDGNDPGIIADAVLSGGLPGAAADRPTFFAIRDALVAAADNAQKELTGTPKSPGLLPISAYIPAWAQETAPPPPEPCPAGQVRDGKGVCIAAGTPESGDTAAGTEDGGMSTGTAVLLAAAVLAGGAVAYSMWNRPPRNMP